MRLKALLAVLTALTLVSPVLAQGEDTQPTRHILNLDDVELTALIEDVSTVTGYTFIVHPDARTKRVTVSSDTPLTSGEVFDVFLSTLRVNGFSAVPAGRDKYRIVPEKSAIGDARLGKANANTLITSIFKLSNVRALEAATMVKPMVEGRGQVIANSNSNTVIVVDYASNMVKIKELLAQLDMDVMQTQTIAMENVPAIEVQKILTELNGRSGEADYQGNFKAVASETGNTLILSGDADLVERAMTVARELDAQPQDKDDLRIIPLNNASAEEVVPILDRVAQAISARRSPGEAKPEHVVEFHEPSNSLIISADSETISAMEKVIAQLDQRRAQVLVEAIIVDISDDTARELGLQFLLAGAENSSVPFISTNYSRSAPNLLSLTGALVNNNANTNVSQSAINSLLGLNGISAGVGGQSGEVLFGAILNAVETDKNSRILSKPFNMTIDNGRSSLLVGQEIPVTTGEVLGTANANPFRSVSRQEVGIRLDVTPRISNDDTVRLDIFQEVSSIAGQVGTVTPDLILDKRNIETSVLVDSGEILVLGGLVQQQESINEEGVPLLKDVPGLGRLFSTKGKGLKRTNLMVFIRPTIIRDEESARAVTSRSYDYIRAEAIWEGEETNSLDAFVSSVLGSPNPR